MASSRFKNKKPEEALGSLELKTKYRHVIGDLVLVEVPVDEYSYHDTTPGIVVQNVKHYDSFARVHYHGTTYFTHVHRIKRIKNAKS